MILRLFAGPFPASRRVFAAPSPVLLRRLSEAGEAIGDTWYRGNPLYGVSMTRIRVVIANCGGSGTFTPGLSRTHLGFTPDSPRVHRTPLRIHRASLRIHRASLRIHRRSTAPHLVGGEPSGLNSRILVAWEKG